MVMGERVGIIGKIEKAAKKALPLIAVAGLAISACSDNKSPVDGQLRTLHKQATELCTDEAKDKTAAQFPDVTVPNAPTVEQLRVALEAAESRESQAPEFLQTSFDECFYREYTSVIEKLGTPTISVDGTAVPTESTLATVTTEA